MPNYVVIYHANESAMEQMSGATPEQMAEGMKPWMDWAAKCGDGLVDMGTPLGGGQRLSQSGSAASDKGVVGYSILQAENMDAAKALLAGHPHLGWNVGCDIEVHESFAIPM
ncbi:MAG: YCII-related domain-containing protein [Chloroflexi bacterium]|nr:MAG: YCII-related domain-containing protein [Chloroflexota bacterium]